MNASLHPPIFKAGAILVAVALHIFHPAGQAAALPPSLLVLAGAWLADATLSGGTSWSSVGNKALLGPGTMPFYFGMLLLNAVVSTPASTGDQRCRACS